VSDVYLYLTRISSSRQFFSPENKKAMPRILVLKPGLCFHDLCWLSMLQEKNMFSTFIVFIDDWGFGEQMLN